MPDNAPEVIPEGNAPEKPQYRSMVNTDAFASAMKSLNVDDNGNAAKPEEVEEKETPEAAAPEEKGNTAPPKEDPEHVKWAKSVDGYFDRETGQPFSDRIIKAAFE